MKDARSYIIAEISPANIDLDAENKISFTDTQVFAIVQRVLVDAEGFLEDERARVKRLQSERVNAINMLSLQGITQTYIDARERMSSAIRRLENSTSIGKAAREEEARFQDLANALVRLKTIARQQEASDE